MSDWLLGLQQILWENCEDDSPIKDMIRSNFQRDVESLSYLASRLPEAKKRVRHTQFYVNMFIHLIIYIALPVQSS